MFSRRYCYTRLIHFKSGQIMSYIELDEGRLKVATSIKQMDVTIALCRCYFG